MTSITTPCDDIVIKLFNNLIDNLVDNIYLANLIDVSDKKQRHKREFLLDSVAKKEQYLYKFGKAFNLSKEFFTRECLIRLIVKHKLMFPDDELNKLIKYTRDPDNVIEYFCTRYKNVSLNPLMKK